MRRMHMAVAVAAMLTGCGDAGREGGSNASQASAYDPNPPFDASDIDATVEETRRRMATPTPVPAAPQAETASPADTAPNSQDSARTTP